MVSVPAAPVRKKLREFDKHYVSLRNKLRRFAEALAGELKPTVTVDGFIWAAERALFNPGNDFERFDRITIRNELPGMANVLFSNDRAFLQELVEELERIKIATLNLD